MQPVGCSRQLHADDSLPPVADTLHRPARTPAPDVPTEPLVVAAPPVPQAAVSSGPAGVVQYALPAVASLGSLVFVLANPRPLFIIGGVLFALTAVLGGVALGLSQRSQSRQRRLRDRVRYLEHLDDVAGQAQQAAEAQRAATVRQHPAPAGLWQLADLPARLWERRRDAPDALQVRLGTARLPLARPVQLENRGGPMSDVDEVCLQAANRLVEDVATVPGLPLAVDLARYRSVVVTGPEEPRRQAARALLAQLLAWHAPDDLRVAVLSEPGRVAAWTWLKWAPHAVHPAARDETGPERLVTSDVGELARLLGSEVAARPAVTATAMQTGGIPSYELVVLVDRDEVPRSGSAPLDAVLSGLPVRGVTVISLLDRAEQEPSHVDLRVLVDDLGGVQVQGPDGVVTGSVDRFGLSCAEQLARRLAPLRLSPEDSTGATGSAADLRDVLGADPDAIDPARSWLRRPEHAQLRVPLGIDPDGRPVYLDLKESALAGSGPHGLCVGATGSGKSELLRTLVLALATSHPPERLAMVLVDFKGGATFSGLGRLPHVAGSLTNLADDLALVERFRDALVGEAQRRQELLNASGGYASVRDYEAARAAGADLEPLPSLLIVVDEFSELLAVEPDFIDAFVTVGRLGRSLGMHLLLASQRLEEGRLRGLDSHLSYRIALRTFSAQESRTVLGVTDAYELPSVPGSAYLKVDTTVFQPFQAAYVSGAWARPAAEPEDGGPAPRAVLPFTAAPLHRGPAPVVEASRTGARSVLEVVVDRLADAAPRAHQVWLPPLALAPPLDALVPAVERGRLQVPVGLLDRPAEQAQEPLVLDLSGAAGNVVVVGGPQTGKTTALRTLVAALALTHSPDDVQVYAVDLGGGLGVLAGLPHVGTTATRGEPELVRRVVGELVELLAERDALFRRRGVDGAAAMRLARAEGRLPEESRGDVLLLVDGWSSFRREFEDLEPLVTELAARGPGYGIHVVLATPRWTDLRPQLRDSLGTRLELRLVDAIESELGRAAAAVVPQGRPGRGLVPGPLHIQVAAPRADGQPGDVDLRAASTALVDAVRERWGAREAPAVRTLPPLVVAEDLPAAGADTRPGVPVGLGENDLGPAYVDLTGPDPHLLVLGDGQSGKTTLLRTFLHGLAARCTPEQARVVLVDYRRTLLGAIPDSHLLAYAGAAPALEPVIDDLAGSLGRRLPGLDVSADQLRSRSWWTGPEVYVVVDDHDLVVTALSNPLAPLVDLLAQARDVGLHVVVARRTGGAGRAFFEPLLQRLRDLGTPGLLLSGDPGEGALIGPHRAQAQPAGRGLLVTRGSSQLVQVATDEPPGH